MLAYGNNYRYTKIGLLTACLLTIVHSDIQAQHNGDPLFYQGVITQNAPGVRSAAYGNAYTSRSNDLNEMFHNPAGLADISSIQISVAADYKTYLERDNQNFYPGNEYFNTSLYMEHLVNPDPAWDGLWSDSLGLITYDSLGNPIGQYWNMERFLRPVQGKDEYSEEAADHQEKYSRTTLDHITAAYPFRLAGKNFVAAASWYRNLDGYDYDWNGSHLDPHWGTSTIIQAKAGDTTRTNWSEFNRTRTGGIYSLTAALAMNWEEYLNAGVRINYTSGETDDRQSLERIGYFLTLHQLTDWSFSYDSYQIMTTGSSKFSALDIAIGAQYISEFLNLGVNIRLPYTMERNWQYRTQITQQGINTSSDSSGTDKISLPAAYTLGLTIKPGNGLIFSIDVETAKLSAAEYERESGSGDSLTVYSKLADHYALRFGLEYQATENFSLLAGYQTRNAPFIPYGAAIRDEGPPSYSYSFGASFSHGMHRFDVAYTYYQLKYYDAYMTNRNFSLESYQRIQLGYTISL